MRRPTIRVVLDGYSSLVSGYGSRDLVEKVTGRAPAYSTIRRGWVVQEPTARDVIALAEASRCDIVITGSRASRATSLSADEQQVVAEHDVVGDRLW